MIKFYLELFLFLLFFSFCISIMNLCEICLAEIHNRYFINQILNSKY